MHRAQFVWVLVLYVITGDFQLDLLPTDTHFGYSCYIYSLDKTTQIKAPAIRLRVTLWAL